MKTVVLCLANQVIRIDTDAMTANQSGFEMQEVPFCSGRGQHLIRVDAYQMEYLGQLVHKSDIDIALGVLDHLGGFGHFYTGDRESSGRNHRAIQRIHFCCRFGSGTGGDFHNLLYSMFLIAGIDTLRRISGKEITVENES